MNLYPNSALSSLLSSSVRAPSALNSWHLLWKAVAPPDLLLLSPQFLRSHSFTGQPVETRVTSTTMRSFLTDTLQLSCHVTCSHTPRQLAQRTALLCDCQVLSVNNSAGRLPGHLTFTSHWLFPSVNFANPRNWLLCQVSSIYLKCGRSENLAQDMYLWL